MTCLWAGLNLFSWSSRSGADQLLTSFKRVPNRVLHSRRPDQIFPQYRNPDGFSPHCNRSRSMVTKVAVNEASWSWWLLSLFNAPTFKLSARNANVYLISLWYLVFIYTASALKRDSVTCSLWIQSWLYPSICRNRLYVREIPVFSLHVNTLKAQLYRLYIENIKNNNYTNNVI